MLVEFLLRCNSSPVSVQPPSKMDSNPGSLLTSRNFSITFVKADQDGSPSHSLMFQTDWRQVQTNKQTNKKVFCLFWQSDVTRWWKYCWPAWRRSPLTHWTWLRRLEQGWRSGQGIAYSYLFITVNFNFNFMMPCFFCYWYIKDPLHPHPILKCHSSFLLIPWRCHLFHYLFHLSPNLYWIDMT